MGFKVSKQIMDNPEMKPTPVEIEQPSSIHVDRSGIHPIVTALLAFLLALETLALGYVIVQYSNLQKTQSQAIAKFQEQREEAPMLAPLLYTKKLEGGYPYGQQLLIINRQTGRETTVFETGIGGFVEVVAVPQVGYDGRVFVHLVGEGDNPFLQLHELNLNTEGDQKLVDFAQDSYVIMDAFEVSPDQTKLAFVPYDMDAAVSETGNQLVVLDLLSGETEVIGETDEVFYGAIADLGGTGTAYNLRWLDRNCVETNVYEAPEEKVGGAQNTYLSQQTFCLEE